MLFSRYKLQKRKQTGAKKHSIGKAIDERKWYGAAPVGYTDSEWAANRICEEVFNIRCKDNGFLCVGQVTKEISTNQTSGRQKETKNFIKQMICFSCK